MLDIITRLGLRVHVPDLTQAFKVTFRNSVASQYVLPDFAEFCYAKETMPQGLSEFDMGRWTGRHDVWHRMEQYLNLKDEEIFDIRRGKSVLRQGATDGVE